MIMTKLKYFLLICCVSGGLAAMTSCSSEVDDYFDQPASQRLASTLARAQQVLRSAEYGWEFEYYPSSTLDYGGVVYTIRFDSLTAAIGCSLIPDSVETTYYRLTNDNGPVLTFDTYNNLMHYFSTPSSEEYEAKGGDFEFVIDSIADDFISLYGKKTLNTMYLRKLKGSPDEYARKTIDIFDHFVDSIRGQVGTAEVLAKCNPSARSIHVTSDRDTFDVHYTYTDRGIRLYRPVTLGGVRVQTFDFDTATSLFTCSDPGREDVTLQGVPYPENFMTYALWESDYTLTWGTGSSVDVRLKPNRLECTYLMEGLSPKYDLVLRYDAATGVLKLGSQVIGDIDGNAVYWACVNYSASSLSNITITDEGQFTIRWNGNRFYPRFNITPTDGVSYNSAVLIYLYYNATGNLTAGLLTDSEWLTNGSYLFNNLKTLNRKSRMVGE